MILRKDGKLYYFKKQVGCYTDADPRGALNVQTEATELLLWDEVLQTQHRMPTAN